MRLFKGTTPPISGQDSLAAIEYIPLGGMKQCVILRGKSIHNPVLLFLHGGPGTPETAWLNHFNANLEDHFTMVAWEMRGGGKSYRPDIPPESMTLEQLIKDAHELTEFLQQRFQQEKIFVVGHSFGALLGTWLVQRYPQDYFAYVGIGQVANTFESERISYQWALATAKERGNVKAVKELEAIGEPANGVYQSGRRGTHIERKWVREFGGAIHGKSAMPIFQRILIQSPIYTVAEALNYFKGEQFSLRFLWDDVLSVDFIHQAPEFSLPYYICQGVYDYQAAYPVAKRYFEQLAAPKKEFFTFENSAHGTLFEEPEKFLQVMLKIHAEVGERQTVPLT
jgi:pimeloyl-ACP methyl ester carboxylesterase